MLAQFQSEFVAALRSQQREFASDLKLNPASRLAVYRHNFYFGLLAQLRQAFPITRKQLGDAQFKSLALQYIQQSPPASENLNLYGKDFPEYLRQSAQVSQGVAELAEAEYRQLCCYYAPDHRQFDLAKFVEMPPEQQFAQAFIRQPCLYPFKAPAWLLTLLEHPETSIPNSLMQQTAPEIGILLYRDHGKVSRMQLTLEQIQVLERFASPTSIGQLTEIEIALFPTLLQHAWLYLVDR